MSTAVLAPPKLKVALTSLQKAITSLDEDQAKNAAEKASQAFCLLLTCELSSRGIGFDLPPTWSGQSICSLLESIRNIAGKVSIDNVDGTGGGYPAPMMAFLNAACGMAASSCASLLDSTIFESLSTASDSESSAVVPSLQSLLLPLDKQKCRSELEETLKRCQEVKDGRFYSLLKLAADCITDSDASSFSNSNTTPSTVSKQQQSQRNEQWVESMQQLRMKFNTISYANYLYGATNFACDQPQIWKRCLDAALLINNKKDYSFGIDISNNNRNKSSIDHRSYQSTSQTIIPLSNMIRIALSKGNEKRAKELNLFLVAGYVGGVTEKLDWMKADDTIIEKGASGGDDPVTKKGLNKYTVQELIQEYFLNRSTLLVELEKMTITKLIHLAKETLETCVPPIAPTSSDGEQDSSIYETWLFYNYLKQQLEHLEEESKLWIEVQQQYRAMLNRMPDSASSPSSSKSSSIGVSKGGSSKGVSLSSGKSKGGIGIGSGTKPASVKSSKTAVSASSSSLSSTSKHEMESKISSKIYWEAWKAWEFKSTLDWNSLSTCVLRDAVIKLSSTSAPSALVETDEEDAWYTMMEIVQDCYCALANQVDRLVAIAMMVQKRHSQTGGNKEDNATIEDISLAWRAVISFVSPLIKHHLHPLVSAPMAPSLITPEQHPLRRLLECCSKAVITAFWMYEPLVADGSRSDCNKENQRMQELEWASTLLSMSHQCLTTCRTGRSAEEKVMVQRMKKEASMLDGGASTLIASSRYPYSDDEKKEILQLDCALASSKCWMGLENSINCESGDQSLLIDSIASNARKATIAATAANKLNPDLKSSNSHASSLNAKFGAPYMQFLSAWSGMYLSPWPFCTIAQARSIVQNAREMLYATGKIWGRQTSWEVEHMLLNIGEADLESGFTGGFVKESDKLYNQALKTLSEISPTEDTLAVGLLKAHCLLGKAKIYLFSSTDTSTVTAEEYARSALNILSSLDPTNCQSANCIMICIYAWSAPLLNGLSCSYHVCTSRQLTAEACIRSSRPEDALAFLSDAVKDLPGNFDAAFSLAAFHLRSMLYSNNVSGNELNKHETLTRTLLLKAAKMDTTKPDPFALLGVWYESQHDQNRAKGCYQKALAIDSSHPVAGRGLQRLLSLDELQSFCENAATRNSPFNGWAWRALGQQKALSDGDVSPAVICFQQALRCRDIQSPSNESLGIFYIDPNTQKGNGGAAETWAELAGCYRQMGKFSAALRAYDAAFSVSGGLLSPSVLCAWAQVELDLGLYDEAAKKCDEILSIGGTSPIHRVAAYTEGEALLSLARRDAQQGKFGNCLSHLKKGVSRLHSLPAKGDSNSDSYYCESKLLGDLYSFGEALPSYVFTFCNSSQGNEEVDLQQHLEIEVRNQLSFISKGEEAYALALELAQSDNGEEEDKAYLIAAAATDLGTNLLSQARVVCLALGEGTGGGTNMSMSDLAMQSCLIQDLVIRSINSYICAIDSSPHEAPAWCGIGCSLVGIDPLLSQHAFCRALQIDKSLADSWSNIGLLYANFGRADRSSEVLDVLTTVADTPLMWIGRALLLEKTSSEWEGQATSREACMIKAADAYRAALQIMQHPAALLGLSLTCRRKDMGLQTSNNFVYSSLSGRAAKSESRMSLTIHQNITGGGNFGACYIDSLELIEARLERLALGDTESADIIKEGKDIVESIKLRFENAVGKSSNRQNEPPHCKIDLSMNKSLQFKSTGEFPHYLIDNAADKLSSVTSSQCFNGNNAASHSGINDDLTEARNNVCLNSEMGESWLHFAKELSRELSTLAAASTEKTMPHAITDALESAKSASTKAFELLHDRVVNASLVSPMRQPAKGKSMEYSEKSVVSSVPSASLVSEALSLMSWMEDADSLNKGDQLSKTSFVSMQESLLLDPLNSIAANSLHLAMG